MNELLRTEGLRSAGALVLGWLLGLVSGSVAVGLLLAVAGLLVYHMRQAIILVRWTRAPKSSELPGGSGIWRELFDATYQRYKQARKRKKRLATMLREFRASTGALPDAAVVLNPVGEIVWYNQAALQLLGLKRNADIGMRINNLIRHPEFARYYNSDDVAQSGVEIPSPTIPDVTLWIRVIPYGVKQRLLIARDVTLLKQLELTRRDFVANASHELRTPLTVLRGYLDMLAQDTSHGALAQWEGPVGDMSRQAARMQRIIDDLLKLSNLETRGVNAATEEVDMPALLHSCMEEMEALSEGRHELALDCDNDLCLMGQSAEMHSVVTNLMTNALRYTPDGGSIRVSWTRTHAGNALLVVADTGIGIASRDLPRLTERFYRADAARSRETGGTGLGLAIVKHAVERHGGHLYISSRLGQGSVFSCEFPAERVAVNARMTARAS